MRLKGQRQEERREKEQEKEPVWCMWSQVQEMQAHYQPMTQLHTKAKVTTLIKKKVRYLVSYGITIPFFICQQFWVNWFEMG